MSAFLGMRGTGNWATDQVPESWAQFIMREKPNGKMSLYAMQSMFRQETVDSYRFHWWSKTLPTQSYEGTAGSMVYIDAALGTAYVYASHQTTHGVSNAVVYVKVSAAFANEVRPYHTVILHDSDQLTVGVRGYVTDVGGSGSSSWVAVKLIEDDDNHASAATYNLATVDTLLITGSAFPEGSVAPEAIGYDPDAYSNYIQEYRDTLDLTHIAEATTLRTGDAYKEAKMDCLELHSLGIEKSAFWGGSYSGTGANKKPLRMSQGLIQFIQENESANVVDWITDSNSKWAGKTWLEGGKTFLNNYLMQLFRYLDGEAMMWCGDGVLLAINELAETYGDIALTPESKSYGLDVVTWITPHGRVYLKSHPLFSHESVYQYLAVLGHPRNAKFCPLVGGGRSFRTKFERGMQIPGQHSTVDGFYTVGGWKFYFPKQWMVMYNLGKADNQA